MATGHNTWILDGRIAFEPELRTTPNGVPVCTLRLCWNKKYAGRESSIYVDAVLWRTLAQNAVRFLHKGDLVGVEGEGVGDMRTYQDGSKHYVISIKADKMVFFANGERKEFAESEPAPSDADLAADGDLPF